MPKRKRTNTPTEVTMRKRFGLMAGLAGATLCLFAITSYGKNPNTTTGTATRSHGTGSVNAQTTGRGTTQPGTATGADATPAEAGTTNGTTTGSTATDVTTTTSTWSFPGGTLGILAAVVLVLLVLFALFRGRDRTVVRETYASSTVSPGARNVTTGTAVSDRTASPRAASGTGTTPGGPNDPNARL